MPNSMRDMPERPGRGVAAGWLAAGLAPARVGVAAGERSTRDRRGRRNGSRLMRGRWLSGPLDAADLPALAVPFGLAACCVCAMLVRSWAADGRAVSRGATRRRAAAER